MLLILQITGSIQIQNTNIIHHTHGSPSVFLLLTRTIFDRGFYEIIFVSAKTSSLHCVSCDKWKTLLCSSCMIRKAQVSSDIDRIKTAKCQGYSLNWGGRKTEQSQYSHDGAIQVTLIYQRFHFIQKGKTLLVYPHILFQQSFLQDDQ